MNAHPFVRNQQSRRKDLWGSGQYLASRDGGKRQHKGLDIIAKSGYEIYAPFPCEITRKGYVYNDTLDYNLLEIRGKNEWSEYKVKIFYIKPAICQHEFAAGEVIGYAQDITLRYPFITNHIHVELYRYGLPVDAQDLFGQCL